MRTETKKIKLLIVSSYKRPCGIAQYVEFLEGPLRNESEVEVEIVALPVETLRGESPYAKKASKIFIDMLLEKASNADVVNIQLEPGLFGITPFVIWSRLQKIMNASPKVLFTYHTVPSFSHSSLALSWRSIFELIKRWRGDYVFSRLFKSAMRSPKKFHHIVNTQREFKNLSMLGCDPATISHMPLAFIDKASKASVSRKKAREDVDKTYGVKGRKTIGCFGFLSSYKGIETAIRCLEHLPPEYTLLVVGGLHPEGLSKGTVEQPYIVKLLAEIERIENKRLRKSASEKVRQQSSVETEPMPEALQFTKRVRFCGALNNDDFNKVMLGSDIVLLPYAEVGQSASGPAAIALDFQCQIYTTRNGCFRELDKYQPGILSFFEVGNHLELASKLIHDDAAQDGRVAAREKYERNYTVESRAELYVSAAKQLHAFVL